jgi:hypothetical protein
MAKKSGLSTTSLMSGHTVEDNNSWCVGADGELRKTDGYQVENSLIQRLLTTG